MKKYAEVLYMIKRAYSPHMYDYRLKRDKHYFNQAGRRLFNANRAINFKVNNEAQRKYLDELQQKVNSVPQDSVLKGWYQRQLDKQKQRYNSTGVTSRGMQANHKIKGIQNRNAKDFLQSPVYGGKTVAQQQYRQRAEGYNNQIAAVNQAYNNIGNPKPKVVSTGYDEEKGPRMDAVLDPLNQQVQTATNSIKQESQDLTRAVIRRKQKQKQVSSDPNYALPDKVAVPTASGGKIWVSRNAYINRPQGTQGIERARQEQNTYAKNNTTPVGPKKWQPNNPAANGWSTKDTTRVWQSPNRRQFSSNRRTFYRYGRGRAV